MFFSFWFGWSWEHHISTEFVSLHTGMCGTHSPKCDDNASIRANTGQVPPLNENLRDDFASLADQLDVGQLTGAA